MQGRQERNGNPFALLSGPQVLRLPRESRTEAGKPSTTQQNEEHNRTSCPDGAGVAGVLTMLLPIRTTRQDDRDEKEKGKKERAGAA